MKVTLTKNFFLGGRATFTVQNNKGEHYTFKVSQRAESPFFVSLMTGPDNENSFSYMGLLHPDNGWVKLTHNSKVTEDTISLAVVRWALKKVWSNGDLPEGYNIRHAGKCGCCGRKLTTPDSLDRGIGPECMKRFGL